MPLHGFLTLSQEEKSDEQGYVVLRFARGDFGFEKAVSSGTCNIQSSTSDTHILFTEWCLKPAGN
jgi:hypothetical protein